MEKELIKCLKKAKHGSKIRFLFRGKQFITLMAIGISIWILGYFQLSLLWVIFGISLFIIYRSMKNEKDKRFLFGVNLSLNEKDTINSFSNLPSWVSFPDVERVEWINKTVCRLWPNISKYLRDSLLDKILPKLKKSFHNQLKVKEINFGDSPPKIGGIKFYDNDYLNRVEMVIDVELYFFGNGELKFTYNKVSLGIKHLEIKANLRIQLSNFVPKPPFIGAITLTLLENPRINYEFTDAAKLLNIPGINTILRDTISDIISEAVVIPNRIPITLIRNVDIRRLIFPIPEGMIRIQIIEGDSLKASDTVLIGKKTSDPYVVIKVGAEKFKTKVIDKNLNPKWNEYFEAVVDTKASQKIEFEVYDKDMKNKDDFLGEAFFEVENVFCRGTVDQWLQLQKVNTGTLHVNMTWLILSTNPVVFDMVEEKNKKIDAPVAVGFFYLYLDCAKNLKKLNYEDNPSAYADVTLGNKHKSTSVVSKSQNPIWENAFHFHVQSIYGSDLNIEIKDEKTKKLLGSFMLPIKSLIHEIEMEKSQTVSLLNTDGVESTLTFYAALRALEPMERRTLSVSSKVSSPHTLMHQRSNIDVIDEDNCEVSHNEIDERCQDAEDDLDVSLTSSPQIRHRKNSLDSEQIDGDSSGPAVRVTLRYSNKKVFYIVVHKVENLLLTHEKNPRIYIKMILLQKDGKEHRWRTKPMPHNLTMTYDETFQLLIEKETLKSGCFKLVFKVERQFSINNKVIGFSQIDFNGWDLSSTTKRYPIQIKESKNGIDFNRQSTRSKSPS